VALGVPILFGVLRKELSLLMVYQALGTQDIAPLLDWVQIATFLVFLTFYVPCVSTFAVMLKTIGRRDALFSIGLSVAVALGIARCAGSPCRASICCSEAGQSRGRRRSRIRPARRRCAGAAVRCPPAGRPGCPARRPRGDLGLAHDARGDDHHRLGAGARVFPAENAAPTTGISPSTGMPERL
jgi:hypothetical protein